MSLWLFRRRDFIYFCFIVSEENLEPSAPNSHQVNKHQVEVEELIASHIWRLKK